MALGMIPIFVLNVSLMDKIKMIVYTEHSETQILLQKHDELGMIAIPRPCIIYISLFLFSVSY